MIRKHELNLGAGVQSTTLAQMFEEGLIPDDEGNSVRLDVAYFADTGEEPADVYGHLERLQRTIRTYPIRVVSKGKLGEDLKRGENSTRQRFASIPAYTKGEADVREGQIRRQCSSEYKIEPIEQAIRRDLLGLKPGRPIPRGVQVVQYIGISLDESGRAARLMRNHVAKNVKEQAKSWDFGRLQLYFTDRRVRYRFPLIEKFMTRADCLTYLATRFPYPVPRSACVFCPYHDDAEWAHIKSRPEEWARAVEIDTALRTPGTILNRGMNAPMYLHRSCQPLELVKLDTRPKPRDLQMSMSFWGECEGVCGN